MLGWDFSWARDIAARVPNKHTARKFGVNETRIDANIVQVHRMEREMYRRYLAANTRYDFTMNIGQSIIATSVAIGELQVIETH